MPTTLEALLVAAYFVVPGYLFLSAYSSVQIREPRSDVRAVIEYIATSMAFWVVVSPAILFAADTPNYVNHRAVVVNGPIRIAGTVAAWAPQKASVSRDKGGAT